MRVIYTLCILLFFITSANSEDLKQRVQKLIEPAKKQNIVSVKYNPFKNGKKVLMKAFEQKAKDKENTLHVASILNNKVFINSKWYSVGDKVLGYKILEINKNRVLARSGEKIVKFGISRQDKLLKVRNK